jgi:ferredoxin-thioredoxin reductase catalytic subunit
MKVKGKVCPCAPHHEDVRESGGIAKPVYTSALQKVSGQIHVPATSPPGMERPVSNG